jgi:hypothetical protein
MRACLALAVVVVVAIPAAAQTPGTSAPCAFALNGTLGTPQVIGPPDLVGRLSIVPQPDSPIEIQAVDMTNMRVHTGGGSYGVDWGSEYTVTLRNRSDQPVYGVAWMVGVRIGEGGKLEGASGLNWKGTLMPGETILTTARNDGTRGWSADPTDVVTLLARVDRVRFRDCEYLPSRSYRLAPAK